MGWTRIALVISVGALAVPAGARADSFCVSAPGCLGTQEATVQDALNAAMSGNGPDDIRIGPGTFDVGAGAHFDSLDPVSIVGAGAAATTLTTSSTSADTVLTVGGSSDSIISGLEARIGVSPLVVNAISTEGSVSDVRVTSSDPSNNSNGIAVAGPGFIRHVIIDLPTGVAVTTTGIVVHGPTTIEDSTISASVGVSAGAPSPIIVPIRRVTLSATEQGVVADGPDVAVRLEDSLLLLSRGRRPTTVGLVTLNDPPSVLADHVTMIGFGGAGTVGVNSTEGTITLHDTVLSGFEFPLSTETTGSISTDHSDYGDARDHQGTGTITETNRLNVDPGFANAAAGDYRLAPGSALIDAGDPAGLAPGASTTDLLGAPRLFGARTDIGAYEFEPPALTDTTAPAFSGVSLTNKLFAVGRGATPISAKKKRVKRGTTFRFTLSEAASVKLVIAQRLPGRRVGKACRKPSRKNRKRRHCTRFVKKGTLTRSGKAGANSVKFTGRIGRRALKPGRYRATITATDAAGNKSKPNTLSFRIVRASGKPTKRA